nr:hypothetical protein [Nocardioides alcanivorans]
MTTQTLPRKIRKMFMLSAIPNICTAMGSSIVLGIAEKNLTLGAYMRLSVGLLPSSSPQKIPTTTAAAHPWAKRDRLVSASSQNRFDRNPSAT